MYEIIEQKEILHEAFSELIASLDRLLMRNNENRELMSLKAEAVQVWNHILGSECSTMEDIFVLKGKYFFLKACIDRIISYEG